MNQSSRLPVQKERFSFDCRKVIGHFRVFFVHLFQSGSSCKNEFGSKPAGGTHFHLNGFARRLALTQRQKATRKWLIGDWLKHPIDVARTNQDSLVDVFPRFS